METYNKPKIDKQSNLNMYALKILLANPTCLLSGSLALKRKGFNIRREPTDIDIFLPYGEKFNILPLIMHEDQDVYSEEYDDEFYTRQSYVIKEGEIFLEVDVFTPIESSKYDLKSDPGYPTNVDSAEILKMKFNHSFGDSTSKNKHQKDIIHMLVNAD